MINLEPYGNPQYFVYLLIGLIPLMIGLYHGHRWRWYQSAVSLVFIFLMFDSQKWQQGVALIGFVIWEWLMVGGYMAYRKKANNRWIFYGAFLLSIVPLLFVKITPAINPGHTSLFGFLGISYLTFRSVGMIMEMRDGIIKEFHPMLFLEFLLFMPTISSGPIDRYRRWLDDYQKVPDREKYVGMIEKAVHYIFLGFMYKFLLAYLFGTMLVPKLETLTLRYGGTGFSWPLVGVMYAWSMYLFFDFAGYSLFAVAISYLMGIETPMNFNRPFQSHNLKDFWNRWHMTLSFWFRDFVFMRLVFAMMKNKIFKSRVTVSNVAYIFNMLIMGFWHGVTWYYIAYGLLHGVGLVVNDWWLRFKKKHRESIPHNKLTEAFAIFLTFNFVCFSFLLFSGFLSKLWFGHY
ncbi:D-alanyl-lipoteichoic acid biosynthesis protein DltB [Furfurilactobacillus rossiae]|uniref:Teichoic acid D-alanyltransferase n=1 Tax=Furfurilactobacillus rossiae DSM 15814 TaxID=1114972 RepID=A0A0R1RCB3_9LACO|nr:D-alanyl-lipoteichoic acid biosynthesis protein DltB [Furfurilactobacillus rossiae]KRL54153.1 integral membrane protein [Furfurilactobacillus rossiae DSM 15814]MCF6166535.1 D-alanyl-lipoteichoic acid biosynthesis protein DltB [Furfurilactobacillus rossiae]QFR66308.1 D-alanyl-lipoteichoic acid biosynthesis protein DltB [Furfurilactobacillus rossiae]QLE61759.1 D-alanyl transfer protein DltB [Furfurilactobacillus rossiae]QLE64559.1 D-alanyl transfer protein DltB [Furfurilactobacillus rossiae]